MKIRRFLCRVANFLMRHWLAAAVGTALLFLILTMLIGAGQSVWFDEAYSITLAKSSWRDLLAFTAADAHPPLFYVLLKLWSAISFNELWLRLLSALMMSGAVLTMLILVEKIFGKKIALLTMPFLLFAPFLLRYGFEIRMYALAVLLAVLSTIFLADLLHKATRGRWILYGILVALGMLTLNWMIFVFLAQLIFLVINFVKRYKVSGGSSHGFWRQLVHQDFFKSYILAIILYLPWSYFAVLQLMHSASSGVETMLGPAEVVNVLSFAFLYLPNSWLNNASDFILLCASAIAIFVIIKVWNKFNTRERSFAKLSLFMLAVPGLVISLMSLITWHNFWLERYAVIFIIFGYTLLAISLGKLILRSSSITRLKYIIVYALFLVILVFGCVNLSTIGNFNFQRRMKNDAKAVAKTIDCQAAGEKTVVKDIQFYFALNYYLPNCSNLYFYAPADIDFAHGYKPLAHSSQKLESIPAKARVIDDSST